MDPKYIQGDIGKTHRELLLTLRHAVFSEDLYAIFAVRLKGPRFLLQHAVIAVGAIFVKVTGRASTRHRLAESRWLFRLTRQTGAESPM